MSTFDVFPRTCQIVTPAAPDASDPYALPSSDVTTVACRVVQEQRRVVLADGNYLLSRVTCYAPAGTVFALQGVVILDDETALTVLAVRDEVDAYGTVEGVTAFLV